jgi:hypothetical protein
MKKLRRRFSEKYFLENKKCPKKRKPIWLRTPCPLYMGQDLPHPGFPQSWFHRYEQWVVLFSLKFLPKIGVGDMGFTSSVQI